MYVLLKIYFGSVVVGSRAWLASDTTVRVGGAAAGDFCVVGPGLPQSLQALQDDECFATRGGRGGRGGTSAMNGTG